MIEHIDKDRLIIAGIGTAKNMRRGAGWKVFSLRGPVWDSLTRKGEKTNIKVVETKMEAIVMLNSLMKEV